MALPYDGTAGRIRFGVVTPDLTTAVVFAVGASLPSLTKNVVTGGMRWSLTQQPIGSLPESVTFESEATSEGMLTPELLRGGVAKWIVNVEFETDDSANQPLRALQIGTFALMDLIFNKSTMRGYSGVRVRAASIPVSIGVKDGLSMMSGTFEVSGKLPTIGTVS